MLSYVKRKNKAAHATLKQIEQYISTMKAKSPRKVVNDADVEEKECLSIPKIVPLEQSTSNCSNCSYGSVRPEISSMDIDSEDDHKFTGNQGLEIQDNYFCAPEAGSDTDMEIDTDEDEKDFDFKQMNNQLTYDEITAMLGEDTTSSDHLSKLYEDEKRNAQILPEGTPLKLIKKQRKIRKREIEWIRANAQRFGLLATTTFAAIYYFDRLCHIAPLNSKHLRVCAACCLFISAKFNDIEEYLPCISELADACGYSAEAIVNSEPKIFKALDYNLNVVLPIDFAQYFIHETRMLFDSDVRIIHAEKASTRHKKVTGLHKSRRTREDLEKFTIFFLHIASQTYSFLQYPSSTVAIAAIYAARRAMEIRPYNNVKISKFVVCDSKEINECFDRLWMKYSQKFPAHAEEYEKCQPRTVITV